MLKMLQVVAEAKDKVDAERLVRFLGKTDGCRAARVIGDGRSKPFAAQGFWDDDLAEDAWLPDGVRKVLVPEGLARQLGIRG